MEGKQLTAALERAYRNGWDAAIGPDGDILTTDQRAELERVSASLEYLCHKLQHNLPLDDLALEVDKAAEGVRRILNGEVS